MEYQQALENYTARMRKELQKEDLMGLRKLANETIKDAALQNSSLLAKIAVLAYALHKLLTKEHVVENHFWLEKKLAISETIGKAEQELKEKNLQKFERELNSVTVNLRAVDKELGVYVQSAYDKARVKYAADAHYYGISLAQAAELLDVPKDDLQKYIGYTKQHDMEVDKKGITGRLEALRSVLE